MHPVINGVICPECEGAGSHPKTVAYGGDLRVVREVCPVCKGEGIVRYEGKRNGIEWERE